MNIQEKYKGKLFSVLGDSVSTLEGYSMPDDASFYDSLNKLAANIFLPKDTWWGQVINRLGGTLLVNNSISGSMVCKHANCAFPSYGCSNERTSALHKNDTSPDIIMVYLGTNDWGFGMKPTPNWKEDELKLSIFSVAYKNMLEKLQINYPSAEIWCLTLCASGFKNGKAIDFNFYPGGHHMEKYCEVIRDSAEKYGCRVIDLYKSVVPFNTIDGFHPNREGMENIAEGVIKELSNF